MILQKTFQYADLVLNNFLLHLINFLLILKTVVQLHYFYYLFFEAVIHFYQDSLIYKT